jgi:hypothetical protein
MMMRNVVRSIGSTTMVGGSAFRSASGGRGDLVDAVCTRNRRPSTGLMSMRLTEDVGASATDQEWTRDPMNLYLDVDSAAKFKKDHFFFGVANAPYLCEGGYNTPEGPKNSYGYFEADGSVPVSGEATRFWDNFTQHVDLDPADHVHEITKPAMTARGGADSVGRVCDLTPGVSATFSANDMLALGVLNPDPPGCVVEGSRSGLRVGSGVGAREVRRCARRFHCGVVLGAVVGAVVRSRVPVVVRRSLRTGW